MYGLFSGGVFAPPVLMVKAIGMLDFLVLGTQRDPHVARVVNRLTKKGISCKTIDYNESTDVCIMHSTGKYPDIYIEGESVFETSLVWDRVKLHPGSPYYFNERINSISEDNVERVFHFRENEWKALYRLIAAIFANRTINNQFTGRYMNKLLQQMIASHVGFLTPDTIVTNRKKKYKEIY